MYSYQKLVELYVVTQRVFGMEIYSVNVIVTNALRITEFLSLLRFVLIHDVVESGLSQYGQ